MVELKVEKERDGAGLVELLMEACPGFSEEDAENCAEIEIVSGERAERLGQRNGANGRYRPDFCAAGSGAWT